MALISLGSCRSGYNHFSTLKCGIWQPNEKLHIAGILDSSADCTITAFSSWPSHWPLTQAAKGLARVGGLSIPKQSVNFVTIEGPEGHTATVNPYVLSLSCYFVGTKLP